MLRFGEHLCEQYDRTRFVDQLQRLATQEEQDFRPPLPGAVQAIEEAYQCVLHESVRDQLLYCDGATPYIGTRTMRPMTTEEILEFHTFWSQLGDLVTKWRVVFGWSDDNSNWAGVFCEGPLRGTVLLFHHEVPIWAPRFRGLTSFVDSVLDGTIEHFGWHGESPLFPLVLQDVSPDDVELLDDCAAEAIKLADACVDEDSRRECRETAMYVTHPLRVDTLIEFLKIDDFWTPGAAADLLGKRRVEAAIPAMAELVVRGRANGDICSLRALRDIGTPAARAAIVDARSRLQSQNLVTEIDEVLREFTL